MLVGEAVGFGREGVKSNPLPHWKLIFSPLGMPKI